MPKNEKAYYKEGGTYVVFMTPLGVASVSNLTGATPIYDSFSTKKMLARLKGMGLIKAEKLI